MDEIKLWDLGYCKYPNAEYLDDQTRLTDIEGVNKSATFRFRTPDHPGQVKAFYREHVKRAGMRILLGVQLDSIDIGLLPETAIIGVREGRTALVLTEDPYEEYTWTVTVWELTPPGFEHTLENYYKLKDVSHPVRKAGKDLTDSSVNKKEIPAFAQSSGFETMTSKVNLIPGLVSAPAGPSIPVEKKKHGFFEEANAGTWAARIGVLFIVLGLGYTLSTQMEMAGKVILAYSGFLILGIVGLITEKKGVYLNWGRSLMAGAWAGIYFATFLLHYLPEARLITNPNVGAVVLIFITIGMIGHSLKYRSETLTALTYFIAFATIIISMQLASQTFFPLSAILILSVSTIYLLWKTKWYKLALACTFACYSTHYLTLVSSSGMTLLNPGETGYLTGLLMTMAYYATFVSASFIAIPENEKERKEVVGITGTNFFMFVLVFHSQISSGMSGYFWPVFGVLAIIHIILAGITRAREQWNLYTVNLVIVATAGMLAAYYLLAGSMVTVVWIIIAEALYLSGLMTSEKRFRWLGEAAFVIVVLRLFFREYASNDMFTILGLEIYVRTLIFSITALLFYLNSISRLIPGTGIREDLAYSHLFSYSATILIFILMVRNLYPENLLSIALISVFLGLLIIELSARIGDRHFRNQGLFFTVLALMGGVLPLLGIAGSYFSTDTAYRIIVEIVVIAFAYYAFYRNFRLSHMYEQSGIPDTIPFAFSVAATLLLLLLTSNEIVQISGNLVLITWIITAVALLEIGIAANFRPLRIQVFALVAIFFLYGFFMNWDLVVRTWFVTDRTIALILCLCGVLYIHARLSNGERKNVDWVDIKGSTSWLSWLASLIIVLLIHQEIWIRWPAWVGVAWLLPMSGFFVISWLRRDTHFMQQGFVLSIVIFLWTIVTQLYSGFGLVPSPGDFEHYRLAILSTIILVFCGFFIAGIKLRNSVTAKGLDEWIEKTRDLLSWLALSLILILIHFQIGGLLTGVIWIVFAVVMFEAWNIVRVPALKLQSQLVGLLVFIRLIFTILGDDNDRLLFMSERTAYILLIAAGYYYLYYRMKGFIEGLTAETSAFQSGSFLTYLGTASIALLMLSEVDGESPVLAWWSGLMLAGLILGLLSRDRHLIIQSISMVGLVTLGGLVYFISGDFSGTGSMVLLHVTVLLILGRIIWQSGLRYYSEELNMSLEIYPVLTGNGKHFMSITVAGFLAVYLSEIFSGDLAMYLTIAWASEGFVLLIMGLMFKDRILRQAGLLLIAFCIIRVLWNLIIMDADPVYKIVGLVGLGLVLLIIGWIYSRYGEIIKQRILED